MLQRDLYWQGLIVISVIINFASIFFYTPRRKVDRHINLPMSTRSSVRLTSSTVFDLRILYFEGCLIRILIK
jgi:hypothetical protein